MEVVKETVVKIYLGDERVIELTEKQARELQKQLDEVLANRAQPVYVPVPYPVYPAVPIMPSYPPRYIWSEAGTSGIEILPYRETSTGTTDVKISSASDMATGAAVLTLH